LSVDPLAAAFPGWSPYVYALNNPLIFIDPDGRFSTHVDSTGAVIAVYDDGDLGVYQHNDLGSGDRKRVDERRAQSGSTSGNGIRMGKTETWDEFAEREGIAANPVLIDPLTQSYRPLEARIMFGKSWNPVLLSMNRAAQLLDPINLAIESTGGGYFDLKTSAQYGTHGRLLGGYYVSSRSAGNFLAGMNARTAGFSFETFQRTAGGLHRAGKIGAARAFFGKEYGPSPMYGEVEIQYRWSLRGYHGQLRW
jgi:hypothetical protein